MARTPALAVWLYGRNIAHLTEPSRYRYRLQFTEEALDLYGEGARVLSLALPVSRRAIDDRSASFGVSAFLEGLLPEGNLRRHVATEAGVPIVDKMALLARVGRECAGAVQFLSVGDVPLPGRLRPLSTAEVDRLIADLPTYNLPEGSSPQASLAGIQDKVLLTALADGVWGWPEDGAPSSHIIKPEPLGRGALPHLVQAENWALGVAQRAGLNAAASHLASFDRRQAIVVERYDRTADGQRIHQEDFCQALGLDPGAKYESTSEAEMHGSRLSRLARLAAGRSRDPEQLRDDLLAAVTFNVVTGNGDAHSKNYSLLIGERGEVSLAPLYDSAPVMYMDSRFKGTGHIINGRASIDRVSASDLAHEGRSWGMSARRATSLVQETMERVRAAVDASTFPDGTDEVRERLEALWERKSWAVATTPVPLAPLNEALGEPGVPGHVYVESYTTRSGTHVPAHWRRRPRRT